MSITAVPVKPVKKAWIIWLSAAMAAAAIGGIGLAWAGTAKPVAANGTNESFLAWHGGRSGIVTTASGLQYQVIKKGEGPTPTETDIALVNYRGTLRDGKVFDQAQRAPLPVGGVVPGFAEALQLMPRGSSYKIWIPAALGYGASSPGEAIPANSVLIFDLDMVDFRSQAEVQAQMRAMQAQGAQGMPGCGACPAPALGPTALKLSRFLSTAKPVAAPLAAPVDDAVEAVAMTPDQLTDRRVFRNTVIVIATAAGVYAMWQLSELLLLVFACALVALIFFDVARWISNKTRLSFGLSLAVAVLSIIAFLVSAFWFFGQSLSGEFTTLAQRLPAAWASFQAKASQTTAGALVIERAASFAPDGQSIVNIATNILTGLGTVVSALAIVLVGGIYLAAQPRLYGHGVMLLTPQGARSKLRSTFDAVAESLNAWLLGQGLGMLFVGIATTIGLLIVGIPAAPAIGLVAGLCEFVPYLGTIVVVIPAVILGFGESTTTGIWTVVVLIGVQQIQGNLVMPLLQSRMVELPPALTIFSLVAAGVLLGPVGVILATPLTVMLMVIVKAVYVQPHDLDPDERRELDV